MASNSTQADINKLMKQLKQLGVNVVQETADSIAKNINYVKGQAKSNCPVDTGELRNSIASDVEIIGNRGVIGEVYTNCEYAPYIEFGTGIAGQESPSPPKWDGNLSYSADWDGISAQPFLYPALKNNEDRVLRSVERDLKKAIKKVSK